MLKVIGADQSLRTAMDHEHPTKGWMHQTHSSSRPDRTQTRPITRWVIMHYAPMIAIRNHLLLGCPHCQPGVIMKMFLERARRIGGRPNEDVLNLARWIAEGRPTRLTKQVYRELQALRDAVEVHGS